MCIVTCFLSICHRQKIVRALIMLRMECDYVKTNGIMLSIPHGGCKYYNNIHKKEDNNYTMYLAGLYKCYN